MTSKLPPHPMQPVHITESGVARFRENKLVRYILDNGGIDMNHLARLDYDRDEYSQFAQLIGYSVSGFGSLSYARTDEVSRADAEVDRLMGRSAPSTPKAPADLRLSWELLGTRLKAEYHQSLEYAAHPEDSPDLFNVEGVEAVRRYWSNRAETLGFVLDLLGRLNEQP